jgi:hypothetical protein
MQQTEKEENEDKKKEVFDDIYRADEMASLRLLQECLSRCMMEWSRCEAPVCRVVARRDNDIPLVRW